LGELDHGCGEELGHAAQERIVQRVGGVGVAVIVGVAEFGGVGPHHGGNVFLPKRGVVAAGKDGKEFFEAKLDAEADHGKIGRVGAGAAHREIHELGGGCIGEQAKEIAFIAKLDGEAWRDSLGTRFGARIANHFKDVRATDAERRRGQKRLDEIAAAAQAVLFAIEGHKDDGQRRSPKAAGRGAAEHGRDSAAVVVGARCRGD